MPPPVTKDLIIEIGNELSDVLPDPTDRQILDAVEDCIGRQPTDAEGALALIAYEHDEETAKRSIWYR